MKVVKTPMKLKLALLAYLFSTVWVGLQVSILFPFLSNFGFVISPENQGLLAIMLVLGHALASGLVAGLMARGYLWAFRLYQVQAFAWHAGVIFLAYILGSPSLAFTVLFASAYSLAVGWWIHLQIHRPFFDPRMGWYQALPSVIPGLQCEFKVQPAFSAEVSAISHEGFFCFSVAGLEVTLQRVGSIEFEFSFEGSKVLARGELIRTENREAHPKNIQFFGIRFVGNTLDQTKDLGDFIEVLRSKGHVSN